MNFNYQLDHLLNILNITVNDFANFIGADNHLVSSWTRDKDVFISDDINFDIAIKGLLLVDKDSKNLERFFDEIYPYIDKSDKNYLRNLTIYWLKESNGNKLYSASSDIYNGLKGKKDAVLEVLDYALTLPPGQEIYLSDMYDFNTVNSSIQYLNKLSLKFSEVLKQGHNITVILNFCNDAKEISELMVNWTPLYFTGNLTMYYSDKYSIDSFYPGVFIIHKKMAFISYSTGKSDGDLYTSIHYDPFSIKQMYNIFFNRLKKSKQLISTYHMDSLGRKGFLHTFFTYGARKNNSFYISPSLSYSAMSKKTVLSVLKDNNLSDEEIDIVTKKHALLNLFFKKGIRNTSFKQYVFIDKLVEVSMSKELVSFELSALANKEIIVSSERFKEHLKTTIETLERNDNYQIRLVKEVNNPQLDSITVWVKEDCFLFSFPQNILKSIILTDSKIPIEAFYEKLKTDWKKYDHITRQEVITTLKKIL